MTEIANCLSSYLAAGNIVIAPPHKIGRDAMIRHLIKLVTKTQPESEREKIAEEVFAREELFPTVIAPGLAVPHARLAGLTVPLIAMGISHEGIDFGASAMPPVHVIVLILTPGDDPGMHLQILSALAGEFKNPETVQKILKLDTPEAILQYFGGDMVKIPDFLRAGDLMKRNVIVLQENDTLATAIRIFAVTRAEEIPVLDADQDLRGVISLTDILKLSLPEHLLWMENLSSIYRFQPFSEMLRNANETKIADVMREEFLKVNENVPAIQLAKLFLMHHLRQLIVVTDSGRLAGIVDLKDFSAQLFWE